MFVSDFDLHSLIGLCEDVSLLFFFVWIFLYFNQLMLFVINFELENHGFIYIEAIKNKKKIWQTND